MYNCFLFILCIGSDCDAENEIWLWLEGILVQLHSSNGLGTDSKEHIPFLSSCTFSATQLGELFQSK